MATIERQVERNSEWRVERESELHDDPLIPITIRYPAGVASGFVENPGAAVATIQLLQGLPSVGDECTILLHMDMDQDVSIQARVLRVYRDDAQIDVKIDRILSGGEQLLSLLLSRRFSRGASGSGPFAPDRV